jgi:glycosyltransferase involved in cell wall biosynthesis
LKPKLIRLTTVDISLDKLLEGQLKFLNKHFEVVAVAKDEGLLQRVAQREGVRVIPVNMYREISIGADLCALWQLYRLFRKERPTIVHANTPKGSLLSMMAAWAARVPHRIYTVTGLRFESATGGFRWLLKSMERVACLCATKVVPEGEGVKATLLRECITKKPLQVVAHGNINGIDLSHFDPSLPEVQEAAELLRSDAFTFIFAGRLVKDKGVNELVEAFDRLAKEYPQVRLLLLGQREDRLDPLSPQTLERIQQNSAIIDEGYCNDVRPYMAASQVLVLPSYREGFPNVVLQGAAMGLPCVVTDINGSNEIIQQEVNGLIVPKRDAEALYVAMRRCVLDASLYHRMSNSARSMIASRYRCEEVWKGILEMYEDEIQANSI